jgi:preprotein translocase subunit SecG
MDPISIILLVLIVLSSVLLILLVLVQDEQGEGVAGFFSGASTTAFGSRSGNVLTRFTTVLAAVFLFGCIGFAWNSSRTDNIGNVVGKAREQALSGETIQWWVESSATEGAAGTGADTPAPAPAPSTTGGGQ